MISRAEQIWDLAASWRRPRWPEERMRRWQDRRLRRLIRHAAQNVGFYREAWAGVDLESFRGMPDLHRLPLVEKARLQVAALADRLARGVKAEDCIVLETSGATGESLHIHQLPSEAHVLYWRRLRAQMQLGMRPWHRRFSLGTQPRRLLPHRLGLFPISAAPFTAQPAEIIEQLERVRPHYVKLWGHATELLIEEAPEALAALKLRGVFTGAEHLPQSLRRRLESACGCPVTDFYGASETNMIAWQCHLCGLYHTCDDAVVVEVLRPDGSAAGPGEEGEVALTALYSFSMPFIRYLVGDRVRLPAQRPACAIGFGAIESVQGRTLDYMLLPGGELVAPYRIMNVLDGVAGLHRYEAEQVETGSVVVRFQPMPGASADALASEIRAQCRRVLARDVSIEAQPVAAFSRDPATKRRFIRSLVSHDAG